MVTFLHDAIGELPLEVCETINGTWGFNLKDDKHKSKKKIIHVSILEQLAITFHGNNLVLGMNYGVFYNYSSSRDTWSSVSNNLPNVRITELEINPSLNKLYAATYGRGLWVADLEPLSLSSSRLNQFEFEVFPNPVESELTILTNKTFEAQIKIYDFQGRLVYFSKNTMINDQFKIDLQSLNSGMYVLRLTDNTTSSSIKFQKK